MAVTLNLGNGASVHAERDFICNVGGLPHNEVMSAPVVV